MTMEMAVPADSRTHDPSRTRIASLMRAALIWASAGAVLCCAGWFLLGGRHPGDMLGSACGCALALLFLSAGRSVQVLAGGGTAVMAWSVFGIQVVALGMVGAVLAEPRTLAVLGSGPMPVGTSVAGVAAAWTIGIVVAGHRQRGRIYDLGEDS